MDKNFIVYKESDGRYSFVNINIVRQIIFDPSGESCRAYFADNHFVDLSGALAQELFGHLQDRSLVIDARLKNQ